MTETTSQKPEARDLTKLQDFFPSSEIEWFITRIDQSRMPERARVVPFVSPRAVAQRLDDVCTPGGWSVQIKANPLEKAVVCALSIEVSPGVWVTKEDGCGLDSSVAKGEEESPLTMSYSSTVKAAHSVAFKRAAVMWGIGRYLRNVPATWVELGEKKELLATPSMPANLLPKGDKSARAARKSVTAEPAPAPVSEQTLAQEPAEQSNVVISSEDLPNNVPQGEPPLQQETSAAQPALLPSENNEPAFDGNNQDDSIPPIASWERDPEAASKPDEQKTAVAAPSAAAPQPEPEKPAHPASEKTQLAEQAAPAASEGLTERAKLDAEMAAQPAAVKAYVANMLEHIDAGRNLVSIAASLERGRASERLAQVCPSALSLLRKIVKQAEPAEA